jgi:uncharacterized protein RhaS with RHS repeats
LVYNLYRNYESATGRYPQSDPTGLPGGLSTYGYVNGQPLGSVDSLGLQSRVVERTPEEEALENTPEVNAWLKGEAKSRAEEAEQARSEAEFAKRGPQALPNEWGPQGECMRPDLQPSNAAMSAPGATGGVYILRDPNTLDIKYVGMTNNLSTRESQWSVDPVKGELEFEPVYYTDDYAERRGLEQSLINVYAPPLNKINGISPSNPNYDTYMDAAQRHLGIP